MQRTHTTANMTKEIKICGLHDAYNMKQIAALRPDYIGLIFYSKSSRFIGDLSPTLLPKEISKVGVFVNETIENLLAYKINYELDILQLHGNESVEQCRTLHQKGIKLWKAFALDHSFDFNQVTAYEPYCEAFLFDTPTPLYGGSGNQFDWQILKQYTGNLPFWLSGGLGLSNIKAILQVEHIKLQGFDFNSKLETSPGIKSVELTQTIINKIRTA